MFVQSLRSPVCVSHRWRFWTWLSHIATAPWPHVACDSGSGQGRSDRSEAPSKGEAFPVLHTSSHLVLTQACALRRSYHPISQTCKVRLRKFKPLSQTQVSRVPVPTSGTHGFYKGVCITGQVVDILGFGTNLSQLPLRKATLDTCGRMGRAVSQ